jgi:predicted Zn-dependent protease
MDRRAASGFAAALLFLCGCVHEGTFSVEKLLGWDDPHAAAKVTPASIQTAERVETLGRRIVGQTPFTGLDPMFHTVGVKESVLFHRGNAELFISQGLVEKCKTEPELAAVLCAELGKMIAEKRRAATVGKDRDTIPDVALPGGDGFDGTRAAEVARQQPKQNSRFTADETNADSLARTLLRGGGYDPAELDRVQPLLRQSDRGDAIRKQMAGNAPAPKWER